MRLRFCGQVPKELDFPESMEDIIGMDIAGRRVAVCDGASESFAAQIWARLLVNAFIRFPAINSKWLEEVNQEYRSNFDLSCLSWSKLASFERGSFSTLLGLEYFEEFSSVDVISIGDSLAVLVSEGELSDSFPYNESASFGQRPTLFSTDTKKNSFVDDADFYNRHVKTWSVCAARHSSILCMTDALGEWVLRLAEEGCPRWKLLLQLETTDCLRELVISEREAKRMRVDDVSLLIVDFYERGQSELPDP
jgi:hypothetical protein